MSRVSENSNASSLDFSINQAKNKMEDLQAKAASLKRISSPSEDPVGNIQLMTLRNQSANNQTYTRNSNFANTSLEYTDIALKDISEILIRAKEIAIAQSSDIYNPEVRKSVATEIEQMRKHLLGIANRRLGNRYIFSGQNTLQAPFNYEGHYSGDREKIFLEITKEFYVPINLPGNEVFYFSTPSNMGEDNPFKNTNLETLSQYPLTESQQAQSEGGQTLSSFKDQKVRQENLFELLKSLEIGLMTNNTDTMQDILEHFDSATDKIIEMRAKVGSIVTTVNNIDSNTIDTELISASQRSKIEDADVAKIFSEVEKQKSVLQATYRAGSKLLNEGLIQFLR